MKSSTPFDYSDSSDGSSCRLVLLRDGKSLTLGSETVEHVTAVTAGVSVGVVSHVGTDLASLALVLELLDLASLLNVVVLEKGERALLVLVLDLLGLGVDLLLSLSLTTIKSNNNVDACLSLKTCLFDGQFIVESGGVEDDLVYWVLDLLLDLRSQVGDKVTSLNIDREFLASWARNENLHFLLCTM